MNHDTIMKLDGEHIMLAGIRKLRIKDTDSFIRSIRAVNARVAIQAVDASFVADKEHILSVLQQSLQARKKGTMLSNRIEIDILLRLACTNQITKALNDLGLQDGINNVLIIALGKLTDLKILKKYLAKNYNLSNNILVLSERKRRLLSSHHKVGREELDSCISENKLAGILTERANLLW